MNNNDTIVRETSRKEIDRCLCPKCKGFAGTARVCFNSRKLASRAWVNTQVRTAGFLIMLAGFFLQGQASAKVTSEQASFGYLTVFSSTQETQWGEGSFYYPHTGYRIYDSTGKMVKWVDNHNTSIDEDPQTVEIIPGTYTVWAQSDKAGFVKVPVVVKLGRITAIHLESDKEEINPDQIVTTSSGKIVGWKT